MKLLILLFSVVVSTHAQYLPKCKGAGFPKGKDDIIDPFFRDLKYANFPVVIMASTSRALYTGLLPSCDQKCLAIANDCCSSMPGPNGNFVSSWRQPSCADACVIARDPAITGSASPVETCRKVCRELSVQGCGLELPCQEPAACKVSWKGATQTYDFQMCGVCPAREDGTTCTSETVAGCLAGCGFAFEPDTSFDGACPVIDLSTPVLYRTGAVVFWKKTTLQGMDATGFFTADMNMATDASAQLGFEYGLLPYAPLTAGASSLAPGIDQMVLCSPDEGSLFLPANVTAALKDPSGAVTQYTCDFGDPGNGFSHTLNVKPDYIVPLCYGDYSYALQDQLPPTCDVPVDMCDDGPYSGEAYGLQAKAGANGAITFTKSSDGKNPTPVTCDTCVQSGSTPLKGGCECQECIVAVAPAPAPPGGPTSGIIDCTGPGHKAQNLNGGKKGGGPQGDQPLCPRLPLTLDLQIPDGMPDGKMIDLVIPTLVLMQKPPTPPATVANWTETSVYGLDAHGYYYDGMPVTAAVGAQLGFDAGLLPEVPWTPPANPGTATYGTQHVLCRLNYGQSGEVAFGPATITACTPPAAGAAAGTYTCAFDDPQANPPIQTSVPPKDIYALCYSAGPGSTPWPASCEVPQHLCDSGVADHVGVWLNVNQPVASTCKNAAYVYNFIVEDPQNGNVVTDECNGCIPGGGLLPITTAPTLSPTGTGAPYCPEPCMCRTCQLQSTNDVPTTPVPSPMPSYAPSAQPSTASPTYEPATAAPSTQPPTCATASGQGGAGGSKGKHNMSGGTIFAIILFSMVGGDFVLGVMWGKHSHGKFAHPHAGGVRRFFYYVGDGFGFALNGCALIRKPFAPAELGGREQRPSSFELSPTKKSSKSRMPQGHVAGIESDAMVLVDDQQEQNTGYSSI